MLRDHGVFEASGRSAVLARTQGDGGAKLIT